MLKNLAPPWLPGNGLYGGTIINHGMVANRDEIMHSADWLGPGEGIVDSCIMS